MLDEATIVQLEYFRSVVRLGSLTRAAESLSVTQPTLSTAIARLERQYRVQLLARIPRKGVEPTLAGSRLLETVEPLLDTVGRLGSIARGTDDPLRGELSVGVYSPLAPFYSPTIVLEAARLMPGVTLTMSEGDLDELPEALRRRQLDVALMYADELTPEFGIVRLLPISPHVVVAEGHRLVREGRTSVSLHELVDEPAVFLSIPQSFNRYMSYFRALGIEPNIKHTSPSYEVIRSYVASGLGYSLLHHQHLTQETHCGRRLVPLRIEEDVTPSLLSAVTSTAGRQLPRTEHMLKVLAGVVDQFAARAPR
ncbi:LysR family transcriptional regulator [Paeniglutamicibacter sp. R2-26]|uniref:LysR family transcriptional regulator n=1 Tax=Paeniglutamicibacter sp. R2-26 TaxID=3144417 RepID=UPI003EE5AA8F